MLFIAEQLVKIKVVIDILNSLILSLLTNCRLLLYKHGIVRYSFVMFSSHRGSNPVNRLNVLLKHRQQKVHHLPSLLTHQWLPRMKNLCRQQQLVSKYHNMLSQCYFYMMHGCQLNAMRCDMCPLSSDHCLTVWHNVRRDFGRHLVTWWCRCA